MRTILFDSSTLISLATTCSLHILERLKKDYGGDFLISNSVKAETIDKAAHTLRFRYEGYRLQNLIKSGVFKVYNENQYRARINELVNLANSSCYAYGKPIKIIHPGEISLLAAAEANGADAVAIDERTTRLLVEAPSQLAELLGHRLHTHIRVNKKNLEVLQRDLSNIKIIRSVDLALAAFKKGYLGKPTRDLFESILWALKFAGCAVSSQEINQYINELI